MGVTTKWRTDRVQVLRGLRITYQVKKIKIFLVHSMQIFVIIWNYTVNFNKCFFCITLAYLRELHVAQLIISFSLAGSQLFCSASISCRAGLSIDLLWSLHESHAKTNSKVCAPFSLLPLPHHSAPGFLTLD